MQHILPVVSQNEQGATEEMANEILHFVSKYLYKDIKLDDDLLRVNLEENFESVYLIGSDNSVLLSSNMEHGHVRGLIEGAKKQIYEKLKDQPQFALSLLSLKDNWIVCGDKKVFFLAKVIESGPEINENRFSSFFPLAHLLDSNREFLDDSAVANTCLDLLISQAFFGDKIEIYKIKHLICSNKKLQSAPIVLKSCISLNKLDLSDNMIKELELPRVFDILKELNLEKNQLKVIEDKIFEKLPLLKLLNINYNQISDVPEPPQNKYDIENFRLEIKENPIDLLPLSMSKVSIVGFKESSTSSSIVSKNGDKIVLSKHIFEIVPKAVYSYSSQLITLDLSFNENLLILDEGIERLVKLKKLLLKHCKNLREIHSNISKLSYLSHLDVSFCPSLEDLPSSIGELTNLKTLLFAKSTLLEQKFHFHKGSDVVSYLKDFQKGKEMWNQVKLVLLGRKSKIIFYFFIIYLIILFI